MFFLNEGRIKLIRIRALHKLMRGGLESTKLVADQFRINRLGDYIIFDYNLKSNISSMNYYEIRTIKSEADVEGEG